MTLLVKSSSHAVLQVGDLQVVAGGGENHDLAQDADEGDLEVGTLGAAEQDLVGAERVVDDTRVVNILTLHAQKDLHV